MNERDPAPVTGSTPRGLWTIAIYAGPSPFDLAPAAHLPCPALTAGEVEDRPARFVADPFMVRRGAIWFLFFEAFDSAARRGVIALATSPDLRTWRYRGVVLEEPFHLSYPQVFEHRGEFFMVPETLAPETVRLYRAADFPGRWVHEVDLLRGRFADSTMVRHAGRWWMFTCGRPDHHDRLDLYESPALRGPWRQHPASPIVAGDASRARPAGRIVVSDKTLIRYAQDCVPCYGFQVRAFEILELTRSSYREREHAASPVLRPGRSGRQPLRLHHVDPHPTERGWVACVDRAC